MLKPFVFIIVVVILGLITSSSADAGVILGTTMGSTASAPPLNQHPQPRDDLDVATTINITFLTTSAIITQAAKAFPSYNFVFAGAAGVGSHFTPIDASDFNISQYAPWVVTSPTIKSPGGTSYNRGVINQDAGGTNILFGYTPTANDPMSVNFLQAYSTIITSNPGETSQNGTVTSIVAMDNLGGTVPYYNSCCASGTDSNDIATVPLQSNSTTGMVTRYTLRLRKWIWGNGEGLPAHYSSNRRDDYELRRYLRYVH